MKTFIKNRKNQNIAVLIDFPKNPIGLALIMHGLSGNKEQPHIAAIAETFFKHQLITVRFDTTNTFGQSDGVYENATISNYFEDLEDVISWTKKSPWFISPFFLSGHSVGGFCTTLYAENHPKEVRALFPISPIISGSYWAESLSPEELSNWKASGWQIKKSPIREGLVKKLRWNFVEDALTHTILKNIAQLTMPVFITVGENDAVAKLAHQKIFIKRLLSPQKKLFIIKGAPHTFIEHLHLQELRNSIENSLRHCLKDN